MPFLRPASPNPLQLPSSPMDSSPMDFTSSPTMTNPNTNPTSSGFTFANPLSRIIHSPTPTPAHLRSRTRRPSSLSLGFDRIKTFGFGTSSSSSPSSGGPNGPTGVAPSSASSGGSTHNNMGMNITANTNVNPAPSVLQPAPTIFDLETTHNNGRGRASSTASSMSFSFSPSRRSVSLEDNPPGRGGGGNTSIMDGRGNTMDENEETPNANSNRRRSNRLSNLSSLKRRRQMIGISGQNESESSLSNASNGRNTPDMTLHTPSGIGVGFGIPRGIEDDVDALAMDFAGTGSQPSSSPNKEMTLTPPRGTVPLADVSPFATKGALKPARLLRIQNELTAPFLDGETRSEAAFTRLVASTSDLASRLRLTTSTPSSSPARGKRQQNRWMANWAANNANGAGNGIGGGDNLGGGFGGGSGSGSVLANGGAGRFPESVIGDGEGAVGSDETDSDGDGIAEATFVISRPSSGLGHASGAISIPMGMGGRSRSGSGVMGDAMMMMVGSYGASAEMGDGGMDLDMVSNMSSPISTPAATSWREPAPFFQSKKRKFSAAVDAERLDIQPQVKKRKGMSPHGTSIPLSASSSSSSPFNFPQPRSPHQSFQGAQLSMTSISSAANANQMSSHSYFSPFGTPFSAASAPGSGNPNGNGNGNGGGTALGMTGLGSGISTGNGHHHHRKSGSISTMAWSRPGSTHSSPLLRPSSGQGNTGPSMPAPPGMLLGPSMLSISSTLSAPAGVSNGSNMNSPNGNGNSGPFNFNFSAARGGPGAGGGGGGGGGQGGMSSPAFQPYPNMALGEFGAPLTASPSNRPMMKLPERALHAMGAAAATSGGGPGNAGSG